MSGRINSTMRKIWKKMAHKEYRDGYVSAHISNTVASQIFRLRKRLGLTQTQLAERAGMRQSRISALEDTEYENIELNTLKRIASAAGVGLTVRFVPLSSIVEFAGNLEEEDLDVPTYEEDSLGRAEATEAKPAGKGNVGTAEIFKLKAEELEAAMSRALRADMQIADPAYLQANNLQRLVSGYTQIFQTGCPTVLDMSAQLAKQTMLVVDEQVGLAAASKLIDAANLQVKQAINPFESQLSKSVIAAGETRAWA